MAGSTGGRNTDGPGGQPATNLVSSIAVMLLCSLPFGLVAVLYGLQVGPKYKKGDFDGAQHSSDMAEKWMYAGVGFAIIVGIVSFAVHRIMSGRFFF